MGAKRLNNAVADSLAELPGALVTVRWFLLLLVALAAASLPKLFARGQNSGHTIGTYSWLWVILLSGAGVLALAELALLVLLWTRAGQRLEILAGSLYRRMAGQGWRNGVGIVAVWAGFVLVVLWRYQKHFADFAPQVWLFWLAAGVGALFLAAWKKMPYAGALLIVTLFYAAGVKTLGYLPDISAYPFSIGWSEASRYYYASLPYSRWLYGFQIPLSFLHPTRYLLQSIAFWVPGAGIEFHRIWQVILWLVFSLLAGLALARRLMPAPRAAPRAASRGVTLALALWIALFALQGPVYYHLLVCAVLVFFGFDRKRFWKTLIFVVLASAWAGISRVNWIPVPAMLAAALYLLEKPVCEDARPSQSQRLSLKQTWAAQGLRYLWPPLAWGVAGGLAALAAQGGYVFVSGHENASDFGTSFTSPLLWYRLFASPTFPLGVLPAILLVSTPLLVLICGNWLLGWKNWHPLRVLALLGMAVTLLIGGLVVSAKIGGGSNIHNMDAFLILLVLIGSSVGLGRYASETGARGLLHSPKRTWLPWPLLMAIVLLPVIWNLNIHAPFVNRDFKQAAYDLDKLNSIVQEYAARGEVLFITQRQLEVFNQVPGVKLVPDYELLTLMEMSISNNRPYLDRFNQDLKNHRFALIVADRQHNDIIDPDEYSFAEENNAWVENVSQPLLKYYQEELYFDTQGIQLLVPRK